jgi:hypothetical protein
MFKFIDEVIIKFLEEFENNKLLGKIKCFFWLT